MSSTGTVPKFTRKSTRSPLKKLQQVSNAPVIRKPLIKETGSQLKIKLGKPNHALQSVGKIIKPIRKDSKRDDNDKENYYLREYESKGQVCKSTSSEKKGYDVLKDKIKRSNSDSRPYRELKSTATAENSSCGTSLKGKTSEELNNTVILDNKKITYTRENYNIDFAEATDDVFVDAKSFFANNKAGKIKNVISCINYNNCSPIPKEVTRRSSNFNLYLDKIDVPSPKKPAEKTTLKKKNKRRASANLTKPFLLDIYSTDYVEDIMTYLIGLEAKHTLREIEAVTYICIDYRFQIVNWILKIIDLTNAADSVFYMSMRLFHYIIISLRMRRSSYMLIAITCFWIIHKVFDSTVTIQLARLFSLCSGKYSKNEFLSMERKILRKTNFDLNIIDHNDFLCYYLWKMALPNKKLLNIASHFVLDCCVLFNVFIITSPSILSAAAVFVACQAMGEDVSCVTGKMLKWIDNKTLKNTSGIVMQHVCFVIKNNINGPIDKYSTLNNMYVTNTFKKYFCSLSSNN